MRFGNGAEGVLKGATRMPTCLELLFRFRVPARDGCGVRAAGKGAEGRR